MVDLFELKHYYVEMKTEDFISIYGFEIFAQRYTDFILYTNRKYIMRVRKG